MFSFAKHICWGSLNQRGSLNQIITLCNGKHWQALWTRIVCFQIQFCSKQHELSRENVPGTRARSTFSFPGWNNRETYVFYALSFHESYKREKECSLAIGHECATNEWERDKKLLSQGQIYGEKPENELVMMFLSSSAAAATAPAVSRLLWFQQTHKQNPREDMKVR